MSLFVMFLCVMSLFAMCFCCYAFLCYVFCCYAFLFGPRPLGPMGPMGPILNTFGPGAGAPGPKLQDTHGDCNYLLSGKQRQSDMHPYAPNRSKDFAPNNRTHAPNRFHIHAPKIRIHAPKSLRIQAPKKSTLPGKAHFFKSGHFTLQSNTFSKVGTLPGKV